MRSLFRTWPALASGLVIIFGLTLTGCGGGGAGGFSDPVNPNQPWTPGGAGAVTTTPPPPTTPIPERDHVPVVQGTNSYGGRMGNDAILGIGDLIKVTFSDVNPPPPFHEERIRDDGNITLPLNVTVRAAGRTAGELQEAIRKEYVPRYFNQLTVTVRTEDRVYFVGGEVRNPSRQIYTTRMTVLRAIDTAGGFTEFASKKRIELHRINGQKVKVNYEKARRNPALDPEVFPGDRVEVPSRIW